MSTTTVRPAAGGAWRPSAVPVHLGAAGLFVALCAVFAGRMMAGEDPALGLTTTPLGASAQPGLVRRVVVTRRIRVDGLTRAQIRGRGVDAVFVVRRPAPAAASAATASSAGRASSASHAGGVAPRSAAVGAPSAAAPAATGTPSSSASDPSRAAAPSSGTPTGAPVATAPAPAATAPEPSATASADPAAATAPEAASAPAPVVTTTS